MCVSLDIIHYRTAKAKVKLFLFQWCYLVSIQVGQISRAEKGGLFLLFSLRRN